MIEGAEQDAEELPQVHVVGVLIEAQATGVVEVHGKLCWESLQRDDDEQKTIKTSYER